MWDRFTGHAKQVVCTSSEQAFRLGSQNVQSEHILLGICRESGCIAARALKNLGVDIETLVANIERRASPGAAVVESREITFTSRAKSVLECAVLEARRCNDDYIGTAHILLGVMVDGEHAKESPAFRLSGGAGEVEDCAARRHLKEMVVYDTLRAELERLLRESNREPS